MKKRILQKFGFKKDQQGIINRYLREKKGWDKHLNNTKEYILKSAEGKEKKSCVVLGSGWLLDVPTDSLSQIFDKLYLVDIVHPKQITHKFRKKKNIHFIEADISGFIETTYSFMKTMTEKKLQLHTISPVYDVEFRDIIKNASMVVSVNILNQLDILICDYILKFKLYSEEELNAFRKIIQQSHIDLLPKNISCIISDYKELNFDDKMQLVVDKPLVYIDLPKDKNTSRWHWEFDLSKTYHNNYKTIFKVLAWEK